ncbi:hypothetical protein APE_2015.1 [Aeropyrum pernix K1]|uniref:DNA-directed RNA polymerase subunit Rpo8 n=1 Tax=Aeropyrum pernix (strain ATCC 700893 / DSM 11879 / JCM 9820 / NBRC 100138 / K1) TaxID=272557 RepID=Q9YAC4_AERPE|nr:DNA-directed RNA polymerase subunit G [Aeropyrum pernix]BAA81025.2 hypothetical protein APE_2015.1 [Aeropyrum pernix K1]
MAKKLDLKIESMEPGKLQGQLIATAKSKKATVMFDVIKDLVPLSEGDRIVIEVLEEKPKSLDKYVFCGHGYKVPSEKSGVDILSVWGILFVFEPQIELELDKKYYVCISKRERRRSRKKAS